MYNGDEKLINDGEYLPYTMLDFWRWGYSNLNHNMLRGSFAEFVVRSALNQGGALAETDDRLGISPYDLDGPWVPAWKRTSRIEVKCTAFLQLWDTRGSANPVDHASFNISPAKLPDKRGDYNDAAPRQRNADIYVFCVYTAQNRNSNILDLSWWEFYVCSTDELDEKFAERKTLTLSKLRSFKQSCGFAELCSQITGMCNSFTAESKNRPKFFTPPPRILLKAYRKGAAFSLC